MRGRLRPADACAERAEGVEHGAQRDLLAASKALPRDAFEDYLERQMAY